MPLSVGCRSPSLDQGPDPGNLPSSPGVFTYMRLFVAALLSALLVATASPAMAERITINDPANDHVPPEGNDFHGVGDVTKVRVDHAPKRIYVETVFRVEPYDLLEVGLDTRKGRPGPEFYLLKTYLG